MALLLPQVLFCDDVFDMECYERGGFLRDVAIFATIRGALPHKLASLGIHATSDVSLENVGLSI
jgi:hypothetical protein